MTIRQALDGLAEIQPHSFPEPLLIRWLRQLDKELYENVILTHEGAETAAAPGDPSESPDSAQLLVPEPYESIYLHYLQSRIDYALAEYSRFNNSNAMYDADRQAFTAWYHRTHMPLAKGVERFF